MTREQALGRAGASEEFDLIVVGGGATGLGVAWDAATRGLSVLLLEAGDFGEGTSSRSTKLIHGGLRYLREGHFALVRESQQEKGWLLEKAPGLVDSLRFVIPCRSLAQQVFYRFGTAVYDRLGGDPASRWLSRRELRLRIPGLKEDAFRGGVDYWDAQFDDARLAMTLVHETYRSGGAVLNYCVVESLRLDGERVCGVRAFDRVAQEKRTYRSRVVVNATGVHADRIRRWARPGCENRIRASRGSHLVLRHNCLGSRGDAVIIPRTPDGRVVFLIPWLGRILLGTTEVPVEDAEVAPRISDQEVDYLLELASACLESPIERSDIAGVFSGYRPLMSEGASTPDSRISRDFEVEETAPGLISVLGGKWTTFRAMAEAAVNRVQEGLDRVAGPCRTRHLALSPPSRETGQAEPEAAHGPLEGFPYSWEDVRRAIRDEMAVTLEDVLARRLRCLFLDVEATRRIAPEVARLMAQEQGLSDSWVETELESFGRDTAQYQVPA